MASMTPPKSRRRDLPRRHGGKGRRHSRHGGRVLNVCASGKTLSEAQQRAYAAVDRNPMPDGFCRRDIAWQALEQERE